MRSGGVKLKIGTGGFATIEGAAIGHGGRVDVVCTR